MEDESESQLLSTNELRLITEGRVEKLTSFSTSNRLHAVNSKGDTPLHLAARMANLVLCDLFIGAGANPQILNYSHQTPADVASAEGHHLAARLLFSLIEDESKVNIKSEAGRTTSICPNTESDLPKTVDLSIELEDLLLLEPEEAPEIFFNRSASQIASGAFTALVRLSPTYSIDINEDWEFDISPAQISGDGISFDPTIQLDQSHDLDFLKVRNRGVKSTRRAAVKSSTRLSIDSQVCTAWVEGILGKGWFCSEDLDSLISYCEGNGHPDELQTNLLNTLEASGLGLLDEVDAECNVRWDISSDISVEELVESVEAVFTRATRLPGTRRFYIDKSAEARLIEPMTRAKQELQLGILGCELAVEDIINVISDLIQRSADIGFVSMKNIVPSQPEHTETAQFLLAVETLRNWNANGRVMNGKPRREALDALDDLDISLAFYRQVVTSSAMHNVSLEESERLDGLILTYEAAVDRLTIEHLPYVRRFAARNVQDEEDLDDVFQILFMGLQRSTRRFAPERGNRFINYFTYWMRQALTRWRADEGSLIRIPVHLQVDLGKFKKEIDAVEIQFNRHPSGREIDEALDWPKGRANMFMSIPLRPVHIHENDRELHERLVVGSDHLSVGRPLDYSELKKVFHSLLFQLSPREERVLRLRFGLGLERDYTLEEVGNMFGITRERIRQIEAKALRRLGHISRSRLLEPFLTDN